MQEPKPDFYTYIDLTIYVHDDYKIEKTKGSEIEKYVSKGKPLELKANKVVLAAYSKYFADFFSKKWKGEGIREIDVYEKNKQLFSTLVKSLFEQNIVNTIMDIKSCNDKLLLMLMYSNYEIEIPFVEILDITDISESCFDLFIKLLNNRGQDLTTFGNLIASKISDFSLLKDKKLEEYITKKVKHRVISGSNDGVIKIWDVLTNEIILTLETNPNPSKPNLLSLAVSPDGSCFAYGSHDGNVYIYDLKGGKINTLEAYPGLSNLNYTYVSLPVVFSSGGNYIASVGEDRKIKIWSNYKKGDEVFKSKDVKKSIKSLAFSPDEKYIACGCENGAIYLFGISSDEKVKLFEHDHEVTSIAFSPDGEYIVSGSDDKLLILWSVPERKHLKKFKDNDEVPINSVAFSADGKYVVYSNNHVRINIWNISTGTLTKSLNARTLVSSVAFIFTNNQIVSGDSDGKVRIWNVYTGEMIKQSEGEHKKKIRSIAVF